MNSTNSEPAAYGASRSANSPTTKKTSRTSSAPTPSGRRRNRVSAWRQGPRRLSRADGDASSWVQPADDKIRDGDKKHDDCSEHDHDRGHLERVGLSERLDGERREAAEPEDVVDGERCTDDGADLERQGAHERDEGVAQHVHADDPALAQPLR